MGLYTQLLNDTLLVLNIRRSTMSEMTEIDTNLYGVENMVPSENGDYEV